jgi:hypothetical protein
MSATTVVRERPIVLSAEEVRAVHDGTMTQLRRVVEVEPWKRDTWTENGRTTPCWTQPWATVWDTGSWHTWDEDGIGGENGIEENDVEAAKAWALKCALRQGFVRCPFGRRGDRLWVQEMWAARGKHTDRYSVAEIACNRSHFEIWYAAQCLDGGQARFNLDFLGKWRPSIDMPRVLSRITLEVTSVRVERVQDISERDILAEGVTVDRVAKWCGVPWSSMPTLHDAWRVLWDSRNAKRGDGWDLNKWVWVREFRRVTP